MIIEYKARGKKAYDIQSELDELEEYGKDATYLEERIEEIIDEFKNVKSNKLKEVINTLVDVQNTLLDEIEKIEENIERRSM